MSNYQGPKVVSDPGDAQTIRIAHDLQICEMTSGASGETRTLARPTRPGIRFVLRLFAHGGGDIDVSAVGGFNTAGDIQATFDTAGQFLSLMAVMESANAYRWETLDGNVGTVVLTSATPSATPSHTPSSTPSATPSHTPSAT